LLERSRRAAVERDALSRRETLIEHVLVDGVMERVPRVDAAVAEVDDVPFAQPVLPADKLVADFDDRRALETEQIGNGGRTEFHSADARGLEHGALGRRQLRELLFDDARQAVGQRQRAARAAPIGFGR
jgi:hypothetical protein